MNGSIIQQAARRYLASGLCVLPADREEKRPATGGKWEPYKARLPTAGELDRWLGDKRDALCLVCGAVSGNLEMIDFDLAGELFEPWLAKVQRASPGLADRLVIETSRSGGRHAIYRCREQICGNLKLARRKRRVEDGEITCDDAGREIIVLHGKSFAVRSDEGGKYVLLTLIETRGEGGLFLCAPTAGYEPLRGELREPPLLDEAERDVLLRSAWELNEYTPPARDKPAPGSATPPCGRPGDDFNERGDIRALLEKHGWTHVRGDENQYWRRPGKGSGKNGWSASLKDRVLYVFSSNAPPFEPDIAYSPFAVYALLECDGDYEKAAGDLRHLGYGSETPGGEEPDISAIVGQCGGYGTDNLENLPEITPLGYLIENFTELNRPIIHGLLREGETMNVIASSKTGKSWLVSSLAISIASGLKWLGMPVEQGCVLHIDNELHACTISHRYQVISNAMNLPHRYYSKNIDTVSLRGKLRDLHQLRDLFRQIEPQQYKLIIIDAFYRALPKGTDENDNGAIAGLYNMIDHYASDLKCAFVMIHHTSKGNQAMKSVTDVGAGAGSQSRAADTHLVLRAHQEEGIIVLESAVRSWPPKKPQALLWQWPLFRPIDGVDTSALKGAAKGKNKAGDVSLDQFVQECVAVKDPCSKRSVRYRALHTFDLSERKADDLLQLAMEEGLVSKIQDRGMKYVFNRPGVTGDKSLWIAALLAHNPEKSDAEIAEITGATRQLVHRTRRSGGAK